MARPSTRRVAVLGGGPGGLYFAALLRARHPEVEVVVHERNERGATFGFGVGLTGRARDSLSRADPEIHAELMRLGVWMSGQEFRLPSGAVSIEAPMPLFQIGRAELLDVLARHARERGVAFELGHHARADDLDADVVVAADGANSETRHALAGELAATVGIGRELYLWCGADFALERGIFAPVRTEHGIFVAHAYPYRADRSTFLIETDEPTWRRAGFDVSTCELAGAPGDASDDVSIAYLQDSFAEHLQSHMLLGNRSRWTRFATISAERWHDGRIVLLGDAIHTAHYSVGSGTKLAMEDAIALVDVLDFDDLQSAFCGYQARRQPVVRRLQLLARRSQQWWCSFPRRLHRPPVEIAVSYMTRAGAVSLDQLYSTNAELVDEALAEVCGGACEPAVNGDLGRWLLRQPVPWGEGRVSTRLVTPEAGRVVFVEQPSPERVAAARDGGDAEPIVVAVLSVEFDDADSLEADALVAAAGNLVAAGADGVCLAGPAHRDALLDRSAVAERLRHELGCRVLVRGSDSDADLLAASIVSGRADAVLRSEA